MYLSNIEEFPPMSVTEGTELIETEVQELVEPDVPAAIFQLQNPRDTSDWQFPPALYRSYDLRYGPFILDTCSDEHG